MKQYGFGQRVSLDLAFEKPIGAFLWTNGRCGADAGIQNPALFSYVFLFILVAYDLWSTRKVHRARFWAGAFHIFVQQIRLPIGETAAWHTFASWAQSLAR